MEQKSEIIKKRIKKAIMAAIRPILIGVLIGCAVVLGFVLIYYIITSSDGTYKDDEPSNVPFAVSQYTSNVTIDNSGNIITNMSAQELWDQLLENNSRIKHYLDGPEELKKLINAQLITDFLDTRPNPTDPINWNNINNTTNSNEIQGIVKLKRNMEDGTNLTMVYTDPATFQSNIVKCNNRSATEDDKKNALKYFTLEKASDSEASTGSKYYAKVATWHETTEETTSNDPDAVKPATTTYNMTSTKINYHDLLSGYTMPFEYLWAFLVVGQDKDFVLELADLVYKSEIEITVNDNVTVNTQTDTDIYEKKRKVVTKDVEVEVSYSSGIVMGVTTTPEIVTTTVTSEEPLEGEEEVVGNYETKHTEITKTNTLDISLTKANVWIVDYTKNYQSKIPAPQHIPGEPKEIYIPLTLNPTETNEEDTMGLAEEFRKQVQSDYERLFADVKTEVKSLTSEYYYGATTTKTISNDIETKKYVSSPVDIKEKTDSNSTEPNFVTIYLKEEHKKSAGKIGSGAQWLFQILKNNPSTANMVDLTKYLLYKANGVDYGVQEFDFNIFDPSNFMPLESQYGGLSNIKGTQGQIYDFLLNHGASPAGAAAVLGNIDIETNGQFKPNHGDEETGYGLCNWTGSRLENLKTEKNFEELQTQLEFMWFELENVYTYVFEEIKKTPEEENLETFVKETTCKFAKDYLGYTVLPQEHADKISDKAQYWYGEWEVHHSDFLKTAQTIWEIVCKRFTDYGGLNCSIPPSQTAHTIDCSGYASWVLYEYGYTDFNWQHGTSIFYYTDWTEKYGWKQIPVKSGKSPINVLQPGDLFVRYEPGGTHHILIVAEITAEGRLMAYDCGDEDHWIGKRGEPYDNTSFLTKKRTRKNYKSNSTNREIT